MAPKHEREINRAQSSINEKRETSDRPRQGHVGNQKKADLKGTQLGGSRAEAAGNPLSRATEELRSQHPHRHDDHGPHHGGSEHIRHEPLHGLHEGRHEGNAHKHGHPHGKGGHRGHAHHED